MNFRLKFYRFMHDLCENLAMYFSMKRHDVIDQISGPSQVADLWKKQTGIYGRPLNFSLWHYIKQSFR